MPGEGKLFLEKENVMNVKCSSREAAIMQTCPALQVRADERSNFYTGGDLERAGRFY